MKEMPPAPSPDWAYFLDVDGTLLELASTPQNVVVDGTLLRLIRDLYRACGGALALISGRSLADLDRHLRGLSLPMAGQHGLERRDSRGQTYRHDIAQPHLQTIADRLAALQARHPGLLLEHKGATLAVHYRLAPRLGAYLHRLLGDLARRYPQHLQMQPGKRVVELKPPGYDKGTAIREFMAHRPFKGRRPLFIGDDLTDEHGFAIVNELGGFSVKVGTGRTKARYRLANVAAVRDWLAQDAHRERRVEHCHEDA